MKEERNKATIHPPKKLKHLDMFLGAHGDQLPPKVLHEALEGVKPMADADPDDDKNHKAGSGKHIEEKYMCRDGQYKDGRGGIGRSNPTGGGGGAGGY